MGNLLKPYALVVMANNDVYYITLMEAERLDEFINNTSAKTFRTTEQKSGKKIRLTISQISSVVIEGSL